MTVQIVNDDALAWKVIVVDRDGRIIAETLSVREALDLATTRERAS